MSSSGWKRPKRVGDWVLGPTGNPDGLGKVIEIREDSLIAVKYESGTLCIDRYDNFYYMEFK